MSIYLPSLLDKFKDFVNGLKANWEDYAEHKSAFGLHLADNETAHGVGEVKDDLAAHELKTPADDVHGLAGAVIEDSGTNDYGSWVRWSNGLQMCWATVTPDRTIQNTEQTFTFPKPFSSTPFAGASHTFGINITYQESCASALVGASISAWRVAFTVTTATGATLDMHLFAAGWWKEPGA